MSEPVMWIDSHCHPQMIGRGMNDGDADAALARARDAGVIGMVVVGTDLASSREAVELASRHADVRATVGLHPHDASKLDDQWLDLERLAEAPGVVAIGETGFDLHYRHSSTEAQEHAFREQIRLAHRLDLALVIHSREAWDPTFEVLTDERPPARTVFHCFTGGEAEAERALALDTFLSFSGIVSFKGADDVRAAAVACPADRMLVETDAPFLTPEPHRGRENEPALVGAVGAALAAAVGRSEADVAAMTAANATAVFGSFGSDSPKNGG
jgi:TatD DNase family protein